MNLFARLAIGCLSFLSLSSGLAAQITVHILTVDVSMNNFDITSPALCELSCFSPTYSFSTVPYYSLDQPRNVTLVYNGDQANPRPFIFADVHTGAETARWYTMSATLNGASVTFLNGQKFLYFTPAVNGVPVRLVGQFDARAYPTDVYPLVITVRADYQDGQSRTSTKSIQLMVVNEASSQIAKGWTVAGLQHLYSTQYGTPAAAYMITNGDGSAIRFSALGVKAADFTTLTFDASSTTYTRSYPNGSRAVFNSVGQQISFIEVDGRTSTYGYDAQGRIQSIRDPYRKWPNGTTASSIGLYYGANGIAGIQEPGPDGTDWQGGRTTAFVVDSNRCLVSAEEPGWFYTTFTCDASGRLATITNRNGSVTTLAYNPFTWKLSQAILPSIPVDAGGGATTNTNPVINYSPWQSKGLPTGTTSTSSPWTSPLTASVVGSVTDPIGRTASFTVNKYGQALDLTDPAGRHTVTTMNGFLPTLVTHFTGAIDSLGYDTSGRLAMAHPASQARWDYHYTNGLLDIAYGYGIGTDNFYYENNRLSKITHAGPTPREVKFTYDPLTGQRASVTDNAGHVATYTYNAVFGNTATTTVPGNRTTTRTYDGFGRVRTIQSPGSALQTTDYDLLNRPTALYDGVNVNPTRITYNGEFSTSVTDPKSQVYTTDRNALGWAVREYDPNSSFGSKSMRYDRAGRLTGLTNRRGQQLTLSYDVLDRLLSKTGANMSTETFEYAANGRTVVARSAVETDSLFLDPITGADSTVILLAGRRFRIARTAHPELTVPDTMSIYTSGGPTFQNRIFSADQSTGSLGSLAIGGLQTINFGFDTDGLRRSNSFNTQNQTRTSIHTLLEQSYGYNDALHRRAYHYDAAGRIDVQQREAEPYGSYTSVQRIFGYDQLGRLTRVDTRSQPCLHWPSGIYYVADSLSASNGWRYTCGSQTPTTETFSYDAVGNRTDNGGSTISGNRYVSLNGVTFGYDLDGNVTQKTKAGVFNRSYTWDAANRLLAAGDGTTTVRYEYNAFGRIARKWVGSGGSEHVDRVFLWDGEQLLATLDGSFNRVEEYAYGSGLDYPVALIRSTPGYPAVRAPVQDAVGNFRGFGEQGFFDPQVTNYDTWGTPTITGTQYMSLLWKGLLWEGDVAHLYYVRNRWYDPDAGRFMSEDPLGISRGLNLYVFANNDPVNGSDPLGLTDCPFGSVDVPGQGCVESQPLAPVTISGGGCEPGLESNYAYCDQIRALWERQWQRSYEAWQQRRGETGDGSYVLPVVAMYTKQIDKRHIWIDNFGPCPATIGIRAVGHNGVLEVWDMSRYSLQTYALVPYRGHYKGTYASILTGYLERPAQGSVNCITGFGKMTSTHP